VQPIIDDVRDRGDVAVLELTAKFDRVELPPADLCVDGKYTSNLALLVTPRAF
jgi:histidinol dehydrogenase